MSIRTISSRDFKRDVPAAIPLLTMGRKAWLFCGSELAGQRAAVVMSLVQSAKLHGHDPWLYLKDVLERLQAHPFHRIDELLPHRWGPSAWPQDCLCLHRHDGMAGRLPKTS